MGIPFIGRLSALEWPIVLGSFLATYLEFLVSVITRAIPNRLIKLATSFLSDLHSKFFGTDDFSVEPNVKSEHNLRNQIRVAETVVEIGALFGYEIDDHVVTTKDGYLLCLHRIKPKIENAPIVYLHHGLLMCSDIWCVNLSKEKNLPFLLHELNFDVWIGNNRGNKYSSKHLRLKPSSAGFWDFSIDEFAIYDIPDSINYILDYTKQENLTYIGFSQGSAQAFAALSINPLLNKQINLLIAISPAMTPSGLHNKLVDALMKSSPNIMNLIFGKKALLPSASFWENIIYPPLFVEVIDRSIEALFYWRSLHITFDQKIASYSHLYSPTSVKSVVHWFQIIRNATFQMFDEDVSITSSFSKPFKPLSFPTKTNIRVPIRLIYGETDSLVDIKKMLKLLPDRDTRAIGVPDHEHLDLIWGSEIGELVIPHVIDWLGELTGNNEDDQKVTDY